MFSDSVPVLVDLVNRGSFCVSLRLLEYLVAFDTGETTSPDEGVS